MAIRMWSVRFCYCRSEGLKFSFSFSLEMATILLNSAFAVNSWVVEGLVWVHRVNWLNSSWFLRHAHNTPTEVSHLVQEKRVRLLFSVSWTSNFYQSVDCDYGQGGHPSLSAAPSPFAPFTPGPANWSSTPRCVDAVCVALRACCGKECSVLMRALGPNSGLGSSPVTQ